MTARLVATAAALLLLPGVALAAPVGRVPLPRGWVGTTEDWVRGLGIGFVLLNVVLIGLAWRVLRRRGGAAARGLLLAALGLVPVVVVFLSYVHGLEGSKRVEACGSCHVMRGHVADLRDVKSETLAAVHYKNRYIQEAHCYTCHTDYGMAGTVQAKFAGLGHVYRYLTGTYQLPVRIRAPYPNTRCLYCHAESQKFLKSEDHPPESIPDLLSGATSCLECHGPPHPRDAASTEKKAGGPESDPRTASR